MLYYFHMPTPLQYIKTLEKDRQVDMKTLHDLICKAAPKLKPFVHETAHGTIIGYGKESYETKSGCKGEWFTVGLANRKQGVTVYICCAKDGKYLAEYYKKDLPKAKIGKSCITLKEVDANVLKVLQAMVKEAAKIGMSFS